MSDTTFEVRTPDWLSLEAATRRILSQAVPLETETVRAAASVGRALAEAHVARATLPPWDNSAMDGYAVRGDDISGAGPSSPVLLTVTGVLHAGDAPTQSLDSGQAIRIMTGAPVPPGADCVVRVEDTDAEVRPGTLRVLRDRDVGRNIRPSVSIASK